VIKKPIITEIDDMLFDVPSYNVASNPYKPNSDAEWCAYEQIKLSDYIICSTQYIADQIMDMFGEKKIYIVPNSIDFKIYDNLKPIHDEKNKKGEGVVRIGYTGCGNHDSDVKILKNVVWKLLDEFKNVEFYFVHPFKSLDIKHERFIVTGQWVSMDMYPHYLSGYDFDIGIAPLVDNNFNRSKSNLRWLEYSAIKVPTVASSVYPFKNSIKHGSDGVLCKSELDWYEALKSLIVDKGKRIDMGIQAYTRVKKDFNMDTVSKQYAEILQSIKLCSGVKSKQK
jgi:glycosyltransferase involved in cell wall biosynthesis